MGTCGIDSLDEIAYLDDIDMLASAPDMDGALARCIVAWDLHDHVSGWWLHLPIRLTMVELW
jgi:hypothetical protein